MELDGVISSLLLLYRDTKSIEFINNNLFNNIHPISVRLLSISPRKYEGHCFLLSSERENLMNKSSGCNRHSKSMQMVRGRSPLCGFVCECV